jgi:hypothetical protein
MSFKNLAAATLLGAASIAAGSVYASAITLSCTEYQNSDIPANCPTTTTPTVTSLSTPGAYSYVDTSVLSDSSSGGIIPGSVYGGYSGASFYDAYIIQITDSLGASISSTIDLGSDFQIQSFQERLYSYTGTAPTLGPVSGALDFWTAPSGTSGTTAVLPQTFLPAGTYVLEVRGDATGGVGGAYSGTLELSPVPVPPTLWMLLSGLAGLMATARPRLRKA